MAEFSKARFNKVRTCTLKNKTTINTIAEIKEAIIKKFCFLIDK